MKWILIISFSFISAISYGQLNSDKLKLLEKLDKIDYAESESVGYSGTPGQTRIQFDSIKNKLSNDDLYELAKNHSAPLRLYSSLELIHRNDKRIIKIYKNYHKNDFELLYKSGCTFQKKLKISELISEEFESLIKKKEYVKLLSNYPNDDSLKFEKEYFEKYLSQVLTKKFYFIHKKILEIKNS